MQPEKSGVLWPVALTGNPPTLQGTHCWVLSPITSKPASRGRIKTSHSERLYFLSVFLRRSRGLYFSPHALHSAVKLLTRAGFFDFFGNYPFSNLLHGVRV